MKKQRRTSTQNQKKSRPLLVGALAFTMATVSFQVMADLVMINPSGNSVTNSTGSFNINFDSAGGDDWGFFLSGFGGAGDAGDGGGDAGDGGAGDAGDAGDGGAGGGGFARGNSLGQTAVEFSIGTPLQLGDLISNSLTFASQPYIFQFGGSGSATKFIGIQFSGDTGTIGPQFGWLQVRTEFNIATGQTSFDILDGAFENSGSAIQVGASAIPEPSSFLAAGLLSSSVLLLRRRKHNRQ